MSGKSKTRDNTRGDNIPIPILPDKASVNKQLTVNTSPNTPIDIDSTPTVPIGVRVPIGIYTIYKNFDSKKKRLLRKIVATAILGLAEKQVESVNQNIVLNVNINMNEAKAVNTIDPEVLLRENKVLREEKRKLKEIVGFYEGEIERLRHDVAELEKKLKVEREARARLLGYIRYILAHAGNDVLREELQKILEKEVG